MSYVRNLFTELCIAIFVRNVSKSLNKCGNYQRKSYTYIAAGPESLEDLFSKRCNFGSKSDTKSLVRRYQAKFSKTVPEHLKVCHIWLKFKKQLMFRYIF